MKIAKTKLAYMAVAFIAAVIFIFFSLWGGSASVVYAATSSTTEFEQSDVMDDLKTTTINGKPFNAYNFPYDSTGFVKHPEIMTVVEYCYSIRAAQRGNYGVYVYFYNPQALNISTASMSNKITLGVKYGTDKDGNIKVEDYEKFALQFCSKSTGDYHDLFYKFKVVDHKSAVDGKTVAERVNSNARRYDISEIELLTVGNKNATAYGVGGTYTFTGYAKGYGVDENAESTLACVRADLETITLDLAGITDGVDKRTYWVSDSVSSLGAGHQNQVNSVFFAIDNSVLEKYGYTLQKIKAEWWEYKMQPALVCSDTNAYNKLSQYIGEDIGETYDASREYAIYTSEYYPIYAGLTTLNGYRIYDAWNFTKSELMDSATVESYMSQFFILFPTYGNAVNDYYVSADEVEKYFTEYSKTYNNGHLTFNEHDFSADLFSDAVDEGRTRGYNLREFDITNPDDLWQLNSYDSTHSRWDKFKDYGFGKINTSDEYLDVPPIEMVTDEHIKSSNLSNDLKINPEDVGRFKQFYNDSTADKDKDGKPDKTVFIFHYACTDYYAKSLTLREVPSGLGKSDILELRQATQIYDFDILTMTFNKNGDLITLGCVSSPVDHWSGLSPALLPTYPDIWKIIKIILILLAVIFLLCLLIPVLSPVLGAVAHGVVWVVKVPFKVVGSLFKAIKNAFHKRE